MWSSLSSSMIRHGKVHSTFGFLCFCYLKKANPTLFADKTAGVFFSVPAIAGSSQAEKHGIAGRA